MAFRAIRKSVALCAMLAPVVASASVIPEMTVRELHNGSFAVVHGRVIGQSSAWEAHKGSNIIFTYSTVEVFSAIKNGPAAGARVVVRTVGGTVDDYSQALIGEAALTTGEEVVLFLGDEEGWPAPSVLGFHNGKLGVSRDAGDGTPTLTRGTGQQVGKPEQATLEMPLSSFIAMLDDAETTRLRTAEKLHTHEATLVPMRADPSDLSRNVARMRRSIARGTHNADINADGVVDTSDLLRLAESLGLDDPVADVNNDGAIDTADVIDFISFLGGA